MPPRKVPDTLFDLSVKNLVVWFMQSLKCGEECDPIVEQTLIFKRNDPSEISKFTNKVNSLRLNIPEIFDDLPVAIFNKFVSEVGAAFCYCRPIDRFCLFCLRKLLTVILTKRLKRWDMIYFFYLDWFEEPLLSGIKSVFLCQIATMKNIVHLSLGIFCDDSFLRCIGKNCHFIEYLDILYSHATDIGLIYLLPSENSAGCPKLQELLLGKNKNIIKISSHIVAFLLKSLPDITYIDYCDMRPALLEVFKINKSRMSRVLQLKRLDFMEQSSMDIIWLSELCPNLEELEILFTEEKDVLALQRFAFLSQLHVKYIPGAMFPGAKVKQYFQEHCMQLTSLTISCGILDTTCFSILSKHCPRLKNLHIDCIKFCESERFNRDGENNLRNLSTFTLKFQFLRIDSNLVICDLLYSILKSTNKLTELTLVLPGNSLRDQDLQCLLDVVDLRSLHSLRIENFNYPDLFLTLDSVYLVLEKCPLLKRLGYLKGWRVVSSDVEELNREMEYSNYDIKMY